MHETEWKGLITELGAGRSLKGCGQPKPTDDLETKLAQTWNAATERAISIVERYKDGEGLFSQAKSEPLLAVLQALLDNPMNHEIRAQARTIIGRQRKATS